MIAQGRERYNPGVRPCPLTTRFQSEICKNCRMSTENDFWFDGMGEVSIWEFGTCLELHCNGFVYKDGELLFCLQLSKLADCMLPALSKSQLRDGYLLGTFCADDVWYHRSKSVRSEPGSWAEVHHTSAHSHGPSCLPLRSFGEVGSGGLLQTGPAGNGS